MATRKRNRMEESSEESRRRIISAAGKLFRKQGFAATSIRAIASEAGVSEGLIYHHFKDKTDLLKGIVETVFATESFSPDFLEPDQRPGNLREYLTFLFSQAALSIGNEESGLGSLVRIMFNSFPAIPEGLRKELIKRVNDLFWSKHAEIIGQFLKQKGNTEMDPYHLIRMMQGSLMGYFLFQEILGAAEILPLDKERYKEHFVRVFDLATEPERRKSK